jgi:hypothetical protein
MKIIIILLNIIYNKLNKMSYNIGDFVKFERSHLTDKKGIVVKKYLQYYDSEYTYMISIKQLSGDFCCMKDNHIIGFQEVPLENKLSYILNFDDWWFISFKTIFQNLLIQIINNRSM